MNVALTHKLHALHCFYSGICLYTWLYGQSVFILVNLAFQCLNLVNSKLFFSSCAAAPCPRPCHLLLLQEVNINYPVKIILRKKSNEEKNSRRRQGKELKETAPGPVGSPVTLRKVSRHQNPLSSTIKMFPFTKIFVFFSMQIQKCKKTKTPDKNSTQMGYISR